MKAYEEFHAANHQLENPDTDFQRRQLVARQCIIRRCELNAELRGNTLAMNAIPNLAPQRWAREWRSGHQSPYRRDVNRIKRELKQIESRIGPAKKFWKPRPCPGLDRICRQYDPKPRR